MTSYGVPSKTMNFFSVTSLYSSNDMLFIVRFGHSIGIEGELQSERLWSSGNIIFQDPFSFITLANLIFL